MASQLNYLASTLVFSSCVSFLFIVVICFCLGFLQNEDPGKNKLLDPYFSTHI